MKDILIIGAGGVGRETAQLIGDINRYNAEWNVAGFIDDNQQLWGKMISGYSVLGGIDYLNGLSGEVYVICTVSNPTIKKIIIDKINNKAVRFPNLIHPTAVVSDRAKLGKGIIIQAFCIVSTEVEIQDHVQLNPQCGIGHDSIIGEYSSLYWNVNISGNVTVEKGCTLCTKSTIIQGLRIGEGSILGANATMIRDIPPGCTAVGTPAKPIKTLIEV